MTNFWNSRPILAHFSSLEKRVTFRAFSMASRSFTILLADGSEEGLITTVLAASTEAKEGVRKRAS